MVIRKIIKRGEEYSSISAVDINFYLYEGLGFTARRLNNTEG